MTQRINRYQPPEPDALLTHQDMTISLDVDELLGMFACEDDASRIDAWPDDCLGTARCDAQKVTDDEHFRERLSRDPSYRVREMAAGLSLSLESRLRLLKDRAAQVRMAVVGNPEALRALMLSAEGKAALTEAVLGDLALEVTLEKVFVGADEATAVRLEDVMRALVARRVSEDSPAFSLTVGHDEPTTSILRTRRGQAKAVTLIIAKYRAMLDVVSEEPMTVGLEDADRLGEICNRFADDLRVHVRRAALKQ